jgi:hypothetical protein
MSTRRIAGWTYVAAAISCLGAYHLIGLGSRPWDPVLWMYDPPIRYEVLPLVVVSLLLAATRVGSAARGSLEIVAAVAWLATVSAFGAWRFVFATVERIGTSRLDALAGLIALTGLSMVALSVSSLLSWRRLRWWPRVGQLLQAFAGVALGYCLLRTAVLSFLTTRVVRGGGLETFAYELELRDRLFVATILLLTGAGVAAAVDSTLRVVGKRRLSNKALHQTKRGVEDAQRRP